MILKKKDSDTIVKAIFLFASCLQFASCEPVYFERTAQHTRVSLQEQISTIEIDGVFEMVLHSDTVNFIEYFTSGKENLTLDFDSTAIHIATKLRLRGLYGYELPILHLHLKSAASYKFNINQPIRLTNTDSLQFHALKFVLYAQLSDINIFMDVSELFIVNSDTGSGDIRLTGKTNKLYCRQRGLLQVHAEGLQAHSATVIQNSLRDCFVYVTDKMTVKINRPADVLYKGQPEISTDITAEGRLLPLDN